MFSSVNNPNGRGATAMQEPFDPNDLIRRVQGRFRGHRRFTLGVLALIVVGGWIFFTGLYTVSADEIAVIQRFGKYHRQRGPGLRFKWPDGIEKRTNVKVKEVKKEEFGFRTLKSGVQTQYDRGDKYVGESLVLTGDLNCAVVEWLVQYQINDPVKYLFKVRDVEGTLRDLSEASMREIIGDRSINEVITERLEIADKAKVDLQELLAAANTGLRVVNVELKNTNVPPPVQPSFNEVNQALQEKERMIYEAREDYNKAIPAARGEAQRTIRAAEGYAVDRTNKAKGDSARFVSLHNSYRTAKDVTRRRMYLEALSEVLPRLGNKYIVDSDQKNLVPLLNMQKTGGGQ
ncbi:MAG: FtsH protease activity modulator HflK [Chitinivibrionales bacterium]|nr:FtsH protease activity modulator HflK [Chitinivibrionales bacterium]MBD3395460.1 FtsH protease activity modulator HflK [Chitinivibrionales bacterium]